MVFRTSENRAQGQAAITRYQQLELAHQNLLLQHQKLLLGQAAYVLDQTAVVHMEQTAGRQPRVRWISFNELLHKDVEGLLSPGESQCLQAYCQMWSEAGLSIKDLQSISANLKAAFFS